MIKKRNPSKKVQKLIIALGVVLLIFGSYQLASGSFQVKGIECYTQYGSCPGDYVNELNNVIGSSLLKPLPLGEIRSKLSKFIEIKHISLYRRLPKTLVVSILLRKPLGTIGNQVLGSHYISDDEGLILGQSDKSTLPFLLSDDKLAKGDTIPAPQVVSLKLLGQVSQLTQNPVSGKLENQDLTVFLPGEQQVILNLEHLPSNWYATLQVILERSKILSKIPKVIDMRFSDPILTF